MPPVTAEATVLVPMSAAFYESFLPAAVASYARQNVAAGRWPADAALELSRAEHARILPEGLATPAMHLYEIRDPASEATVGTLWFAVQTAAATRVGYVFNIEVAEAHRRGGFARRALVEIEAVARSLGLSAIGLNVFTFNTGARALYDGLGYTAIGTTMRKTLDAAAPVPHEHASPGFAVARLDHVVLRVRDLERSIAFYASVLGCIVDRRRDDLGLVHLRAGASMIDLVAVDGPLGRPGGAPAGDGARNVDHVCLRVEPFDGAAILAHLQRHGVARSTEVQTNYGAEGLGPSLYLDDPDGNVVELKGPPS